MDPDETHDDFATWPSRTSPFLDDSEPEQGTAPAPRALRAVARTETEGRAPNRPFPPGTRVITQAAVVSHLQMAVKSAREDMWDDVRFQLGVVQKLMEAEGV